MRHHVAALIRTVIPGLLLLSGSAGTAAAQRSASTIGSDLYTGFADILYVWSSPVRADRRDWARVGLAGAIVVAAGVADRDAHRWMVEHPSSVVMDGLQPFREEQGISLVHLGSPKRLLPLTGGLYFAGFLTNSRPLRDAAMGCASALQAQAGIQMLALQVVQRERPLTAEGDPFDVRWGNGPWDRHAFFSGHASNVMSCVSYWNERFEMGAVEPVLYALALGIGLGRMADQRHWTSDIVAGTIFGYAVGKTVGRRAKARAEGDEGTPSRARVPGAAYLGGAAGGATVGWRIAF